MKISTQTGVIDRKFGVEASIRMLAETGFGAIDYSLTDRAVPWDEGFFTDPSSAEFREYFRQAGQKAAECGIEVYMTHAPYCRPFVKDPEAFRAVLERIRRAVYATGCMGCSLMVVHPVTLPEFDSGQNRELAVRTNVEYFSALAPDLRETGGVLGIENQYRGEVKEPKIPSACSDAGQLAEVIDTLNALHGPCFAACVDTGHAVIAGSDPEDMIGKLGSRVRTLHLHDTYGVLDDHLLPGKGVIDWAGVLKALADTGYAGTLNFEADTYLDDFLKDLYDASVMKEAFRLLHAVGRSMLGVMGAQED